MAPSHLAAQIAAVMMLIFGACWLAASLLLTFAPTLDFLVNLLFPAAAVAVTVLMTRMPKAADPAGPEGELHRLRRRAMWATYALELLLIAGLYLLLPRTGAGPIMPSMVALCVGVHFLPLGAVFDYAPYYVLGLLLAAIGVAGGLFAEQMQWLVGALTGAALIVGGVIRWQS